MAVAIHPWHVGVVLITIGIVFMFLSLRRLG